MNQLYLSRLSVPITTGTPQRPQTSAQLPEAQAGKQTFRTMLQDKLAEASAVEFSKHAVSRVVERGIDVSDGRLTRLNEGMRIAQQKGLNDTLILIDRTAFIVNVKNNKVITTVDGEELEGNVFTNIDGTVII